jgi:hypothetical protein
LEGKGQGSQSSGDVIEARTPLKATPAVLHDLAKAQKKILNVSLGFEENAKLDLHR